MSDTAAHPPQGTPRRSPFAQKFDVRFFKDVWRLSTPYWSGSEERWSARLLLAAIIALNLIQVYLTVLFNSWYNRFYNALQEYEAAAFWHEIGIFGLLAAAFIIAAVAALYLNQWLQIRWRRWLTGRYLDRWLGTRVYYRIQLSGPETDNPDQRIADDLNDFTSYTLSLGLDLLSSVVTLFSFLAILWKLSGPLTLPLGSLGSITVPGYMLWTALIYAIVGTWLTNRVGRPLIALDINQQRFEADFRFNLVRVRENAESIAFFGGEGQEKAGLLGRFNYVYGNFRDIMGRRKWLTSLTTGYDQVAVIFPFLVGAPRYFAKVIPLGGADADLLRLRSRAELALFHRDVIHPAGRLAGGHGPPCDLPRSYGGDRSASDQALGTSTPGLGRQWRRSCRAGPRSPRMVRRFGKSWPFRWQRVGAC